MAEDCSLDLRGSVMRSKVGREASMSPRARSPPSSPYSPSGPTNADAAFPRTPSNPQHTEDWHDYQLDYSNYAPLGPPAPLPGGAYYTIMAEPADVGEGSPLQQEDSSSTLLELQNAVPHKESAFLTPPPIVAERQPLSAPRSKRFVPVQLVTPAAELGADARSQALEQAHATPVTQESNPSWTQNQTDAEKEYKMSACARERNRMKDMNHAYGLLRKNLPIQKTTKKLSKIESLKLAIRYIRHLEDILKSDSWAPENLSTSPAPITSAWSASPAAYFDAAYPLYSVGSAHTTPYSVSSSATPAESIRSPTSHQFVFNC